MTTTSRPRLRDVVPSGRARLVLVGINPSLRSAEVGHHFAGPGNPFWRLVHASGLSPTPLRPEDDGHLAALGIGLTNLCPRATRAAAELGRDEIARGRRRLRAKLEAWAPDVVAFVGLSVYQDVFALAKSGGPGEKPERIGGARVFVVPNPSGLNASFPGFADKLVWFERLRAFVDQHAPRTRSGVPGQSPTALTRRS